MSVRDKKRGGRREEGKGSVEVSCKATRRVEKIKEKKRKEDRKKQNVKNFVTKKFAKNAKDANMFSLKISL